MELSEQCIGKLSWYFDPEDEGYADFIIAAQRYAAWARMLSDHKRHDRAAAQKRIDRAAKAFAALTELDRVFLDLQVDDPVVMTLGFTPSMACDSMERALGVPVPSMQFDLSRMALLMFACISIRKGWIDISVDNAALTDVLKVLIAEIGVKHDALDIAGDAAKDPNQIFPNSFLDLFYPHRWREVPK
ncbi:MAG TPA: hypothetical protein EYO59_07815 [Chromatiaceae bacterium]|jgi:hypothetical protein|nr:hypothetical protein [Chromatiaceae bacterium]